MAQHDLTFREQLIYASGSFGGNILGQTMQLWLIFFYTEQEEDMPRLAPVLLVGALLTAGRLIEAFDDPLIGYWSDRTRTRWGRRIPFVVLATPFYALFFVLVWLPPIDHESALNALYLFAIVEVFHLFSTLSGGPFESLLPEIAPEAKKRVTIVTWQVAFGALGAGVALVGTGPLVAAVGFWPMAAMVAAMAVISRYYALTGAWPAVRFEEPPAEIGVFRAFRSTFANDQFLYFLPTFILYSTGLGVLIAVLPFYVKEVLGRSEAYVSVLTAAPIVLLSVCLPMVYRLSLLRGKAWVYRLAMLTGALYLPFFAFAGFIPGLPRLAQAVVMMALVGIPMSAVQAFPNAIMADVIDYDAVRTRMRREAIYYGTQAFVEKTVTSLAPAIATGLLVLGSTSDDPLGIRLAGPVAGLLVLAGFLSFRGYRLPDHVDEESVRAMEAARTAASSRRRPRRPGFSLARLRTLGRRLR
jgi:GPH family glycoside/pentoside/hexuronide:cation symporter